MRTTLDIEEDVLQAAKKLAQREGTTTGRVLSTLARRSLKSQTPAAKRRPARRRGGVPRVPARGEGVTLERVRRLMEEEWI
jgi:hypothetical protein